MTSTCYASIELAALRIATLTTSGAPSTGANKGYVTDSAIQLGVTVEVEAGTEFTQKNGLGAICATLKQPDTVKRVTLALELCQLDSQLLALLTGGASISSGGNVVGMQLPAVGATPPNLCVEAWTKAWDGGQQAIDPVTSPAASYFHFVFPLVTWVQGQFTMEEGFMVVPVTGSGSENSAITANGPFDDWPTYVANAGGITRIGGWFLDDDVPTATCAAISVSSAAS
jgi:hypothetical protein